MADNLTISIGADTSKLRADLAVAQAEMRKFGSELKRAAAESLKTGDDSIVRNIAARFEQAKNHVAGLTTEVRKNADAHTALQTPLRAVASSFGELRNAAGRFGES